VVVAYAQPARPTAPTFVSIGFQPPAEWYDNGTAETSACVLASDSFQYRADGVRADINSRTRCAFGAFVRGSNFRGSAVSPFGPLGGFGAECPLHQPLTVSMIPGPPSRDDGTDANAGVCRTEPSDAPGARDAAIQLRLATHNSLSRMSNNHDTSGRVFAREFRSAISRH
jgi:hypothetical protein